MNLCVYIDACMHRYGDKAGRREWGGQAVKDITHSPENKLDIF